MEEVRDEYNLKYQLKTEIEGDLISQVLTSVRNGHYERLMNWVCDTREEGLRKALIDLGWTPPPEAKSEEVRAERLTCSICCETKETYNEIVYSQGNRVCLSCKKITEPSDKKAFDEYINSKMRSPWSIVKSEAKK